MSDTATRTSIVDDLRSHILSGRFGRLSETAMSAGHRLAVQGQHARKVIVLSSGAVRFVRNEGSHGEMTIDIQSGPQCVGSIETVGSFTHYASVYCVSACRGFEVPKRIFASIMESDSGIADRIYQDHAHSVRHLATRLSEVAMLPAKSRLIRFLLHLASQGGLCVQDSDQSYRIPTKKSDIASAIGITTCHLSRTLNLLEGEGKIVRRNGWIVFNVVSNGLSIQHVKRRASADPMGEQ